MSGLVPSVDWPLYGTIRKEALLTSQIEGTQATLTDVLDQEAGFAVRNADDVQEVTNYIQAFRRVRSPKGLPISVRLLCDAHRLLLNGTRGAGKQMGELRRSQSWIAGTRPGNAVYVPPPAERVPALLADLEKFIHAPTPKLTPLVKIALVHGQFETIHPFLDGNGRLGRLLIGALLEQWGSAMPALGRATATRPHRGSGPASPSGQEAVHALGRQQTQVARVGLLASGATVTCLDQPCAALDAPSARVIRDFLADMADHRTRT